MRTQLALVWLCMGPAPLLAQSADDAALAELLQTIEEETDVVTKTRMNRDFVPGMVTVLEGDELRDLGARNVWDGLMHVPGLQTEIDPRGVPTLTARGIHFPFNSGSIQILLNGFPIGREDTGTNGSALLLPINLVERIEFVRGPGSVIYGDYAFQGLINIVTRVEREILASVDSYDGRSLDWLLETRLGDAQVSTALGWRNTGEAILPIGRDAREQTRSLIVQAEQGGWRLLAQGEQRRLGEVRGGPPDPGQSDASYTAVGEYATALSESARLRAYAQFLANDVDTGVVRLGPNTFGLGFDGRQWRGGLDAVFERDKITWLAGLDGLWGFIDEAVYRGLPRAIGQPPSPIRINDKRRRVAGAYLQAQLALSERLQLTLGARYDNNGDVGSRTTPRISLVWRPADRHVLKAQYAEGYRSPTFFEIYGDGTASSSLDFEVNATSELSYVYRRAGQTFRATAFRSRIDDMVFIDSRALRFRNVGRAASDGLELEWDGSIAPQWRWRGSLSYSDAEDNRNAFLQTTRLTRNPDWQGGVGVIWRPVDRFSLAAQLVHVGERDASTIGDGSYQRFDVSAHWRGIGQLPLDLRLGVDNVGNARIAQIVTGPTEQTTIAFQDRIAWVSLGWRFE